MTILLLLTALVVAMAAVGLALAYQARLRLRDVMRLMQQLDPFAPALQTVGRRTAAAPPTSPKSAMAAQLANADTALDHPLEPAAPTAAPTAASSSKRNRFIALLLTLAVAALLYYVVYLPLNQEPPAVDLSAFGRSGQHFGQTADHGDACLKTAMEQELSPCRDDPVCMHSAVVQFAQSCLDGVARRGLSLEAPCQLSQAQYDERYCRSTQGAKICKDPNDLGRLQQAVCHKPPSPSPSSPPPKQAPKQR